MPVEQKLNISQFQNAAAWGIFTESEILPYLGLDQNILPVGAMNSANSANALLSVLKRSSIGGIQVPEHEKRTIIITDYFAAACRNDALGMIKSNAGFVANPEDLRKTVETYCGGNDTTVVNLTQAVYMSLLNLSVQNDSPIIIPRENLTEQDHIAIQRLAEAGYEIPETYYFPEAVAAYA